MGISPKLIQTTRCAYFYEDGHLAIVHEERVKGGTVKVEHVTLHEECGVRPLFRGRVVIHNRADLAMILKSSYMRAEEASLEHGSESTRRLNIAVGTFTLNFGGGETWIHDLPGVISCPFTYQPHHGETWGDAMARRHTWGDMPVSRVFERKAQREAA